MTKTSRALWITDYADIKFDNAKHHFPKEMSPFIADSYTNNDVQLQWMDESPVEYDKKDLSLPQFELVNVSTRHCKDMFKTGELVIQA